MKYLPTEQPHFKPVYIFGAGASHMIGGPLLDDFLGVARTLMYSPDFKATIHDNLFAKLEHNFRRVFEYQDKLFRAREFLSIDVGNLETLFSILDMEWQTSRMNLYSPPFAISGYSSEQLQEVRESLFSLIVATLKFWVSEQNNTFTSLIDRLASPPQASFITFNYDLAIEKALTPRYIPFLGFELDDQIDVSEGHRSVLKLHGSADWTFCQSCNNIMVHKSYISPLELPGKNLPPHHLPNCKEQTKTSNLLLPPTWYKYNYLDAITRIWRRSIREISIATHIVIVGYSFPRTDVFFDQMLTLGLRDSRNLKMMAVINPSDSIKDVVETFFDKHFLRRSVRFYKTGIESLAGTGSKPLNSPGILINKLDELDEFRVY